MAKITGVEAAHQVPPKVLLIYEAVEELIAEGEDIKSVRVSTITERAGIGKGTAYDYFDSKDDLIACSLLYQIRKLSDDLRSTFSGEDSFAEQVARCLDEIEKKKENQQCFMRYIHVMTENSAYCHLVREKMQQKEFEPYLPMHVLKKIVERGRERGEIRSNLSTEYVIYEIFSKLLTYMVGVNINGDPGMEPEKIRPYVYQSLLDELCEKNV